MNLLMKGWTGSIEGARKHCLPNPSMKGGEYSMATKKAPAKKAKKTSKKK
jgi:hypothetical protein